MALTTSDLKLSSLPGWVPPLVTLSAIGLGIIGLIFVFTVIADALSQATEPVDADLTSFERVRVEDFDRVKQRLNLDFSSASGTNQGEEADEEPVIEEKVDAEPTGDEEGSTGGTEAEETTTEPKTEEE